MNGYGRPAPPSRPALKAMLVGVAVGAVGVVAIGSVSAPARGEPAAAAAPTPAPTSAAAAPPASPSLGPPPVETAPSVIYAAGTVPLTFDHARHAARGIACTRCHAAASRSTSAKDDLLPGEQACRGCHAIDRTQPQKVVALGQPPVRCDACHPGFTGIPPKGAVIPLAEPPRVSIPPAALKFNHQLHLARGADCGGCHVGVDKVAMASAAQMPRMSLCLGCHDGRQATGRCAGCHLTQPDGRLRTDLPAGNLVPSGSLRGHDAHTATFRLDHAVAGRDQKYCTTCHRQSECTECHGAGVIRPADFHPVDYATLHAVDARRNVPNCSTCHRNQTFCLGCHQRLGVAPDPEGGQVGRQPNNPFGTGTGVKRFHPPGWVRDETGVVLTAPTPASHSVQARRNLRTCVSCHREESCLNCHSADPARSTGISPHPSGFGRSAACRALSSRNTRACLKCHAPGAPEINCQ